GNAFAGGHFFLIKIFPQLKFPHAHLASQGMWREGLDFNISGGRIKSLKILPPVVSKESRVFGHPVFDHFPRYTGNIDISFGKWIKSGFIYFKPSPGFAVDFNALRLDIGYIKIFLPGISRFYFSDNIFKLPTRLVKIERSLVV